jgi:hypothetical protein
VSIAAGALAPAPAEFTVEFTVAAVVVATLAEVVACSLFIGVDEGEDDDGTSWYPSGRSGGGGFAGSCRTRSISECVRIG